MKKTFIIQTVAMAACLFSTEVSAQDVNAVAQNALDAMNSAPVAESPAPKPKYWSSSLKTQINIGQTGLVNWAAGGDNTFSLQGYIDGNCNWKKDKMFWNNRLQMELGLLYSSSKPLFQKSTDRFYLESKWGHKVTENLYASASFDFKTQFANGYDYPTPTEKNVIDAGFTDKKLEELEGKDLTKAWKEARVPKSGFLSPAYTTLALGIDWTPAKWVSVSFAPLTGGFTIVTDNQFRKSYSMQLKKAYDEGAAQFAADKAAFDGKDESAIPDSDKPAYDRYKAYKAALESGDAYRSARFEFGAQFKIDFKVNVNDNFKYTSQVVLFTDYLNEPHVRFNWDNKFDWQIAKYFALTLTTNMIYDHNVMKDDPKNPGEQIRRGLQFAEAITFGFTYTIASKNN